MLRATVALARRDLRIEVDLEVQPGSTVALLGPNGAGKTSVLRAIAGLERIEAGRIELDDEVLDDPAVPVFVPPEARPVGVMFQDNLLFPHMTVLENVAFAQRARGVGRRAAREGAAAWLERLDVAQHAGDRPSTLSGGQAQRVALARALAAEPRVLLLDEPLAALDVSTRGATRRVLRSHLDAHEGVRILVTHDPVDAATLADRIVVLESGTVVQSGTLSQISAEPRSAFVADLAGLNLFAGTSSGRAVSVGDATIIVAGAPVGPVFATVHPRAVVVHRRPPEGSARNVWRGIVTASDDEGDRVRISVDGELAVIAEVSRSAADELDLTPGAAVWVAVKATEVTVFEA